MNAFETLSASEVIASAPRHSVFQAVLKKSCTSRLNEPMAEDDEREQGTQKGQ
jgi:hypothetical protein